MKFAFLGILASAKVCIWTTLRRLWSHWPSSWPDNELLVMISLLFSILTSSLVQVMLLVCILCLFWLPILILDIQFLDVLFLKFCLISFLRTRNLLRLSIIEWMLELWAELFKSYRVVLLLLSRWWELIYHRAFHVFGISVGFGGLIHIDLYLALVFESIALRRCHRWS